MAEKYNFDESGEREFVSYYGSKEEAEQGLSDAVNLVRGLRKYQVEAAISEQQSLPGIKTPEELARGVAPWEYPEGHVLSTEEALAALEWDHRRLHPDQY
ncbi:MAG TPA: hypothetical protein VK983_00910 [Candidatus Limnocylindrales bacterium]|nr:hypothetical protein [Candidatus Limnocylindrales bacterium]